MSVVECKYPERGIYEESREANHEQLLDKKDYAVDRVLVSGDPDTERVSVALVSLINGVDASIKRGAAKLGALLSELRETQMGMIYTPKGGHPDGGMHIQWLQMHAPCGAGCSKKALSMPRLVEMKLAGKAWVPKLKGAKVRLTELIATPTGLMLCGYTNFDVNAMRAATRKSVRIEERTPLSTVGVQLLRFTRALEEADFEYLRDLTEGGKKIAVTLEIHTAAVRPVTKRMSKEELTMVDADVNRRMMDYMIENG